MPEMVWGIAGEESEAEKRKLCWGDVTSAGH